MNKSLFILLLPIALLGQTIEEKREASLAKSGANNASEEFAKTINQELATLRAALDRSYREVGILHAEKVAEEEFEKKLQEVNGIKQQLLNLEEKWREVVVNEAKREEEGCALWDQEETTLAQLVMEYGAMDYLYVVPPEMAPLKLHMHSTIPIPREAWSDVLEIILAHNGIGVKKLNSYARQLFLLKQEPSAVQTIVSRFEDLRFIPSQTRIFYLFSPPVEQVRSAFQFFERFADAKQTFVYQIGSKLALVAFKEEVEKLIALYDTVWEGHVGRVSRVVSLSKIGVKEMERILISFFGEGIEKGKGPFGKVEQEGLTIFPLVQGNALVLIGQPDGVERAEKIVHDTEEQLQDPSEITVFLYTCRHSDPTDLAKVLDKVYDSLLVTNPIGSKDNVEVAYSTQSLPAQPPDTYPPMSPLVVSPPPLKTGVFSHMEVDRSSDHFIADPKTGTILMVIRRSVLPKIRELLHKLDVPKKMVQIEVLLFEKQLNTENSFGLNLLTIGKRVKEHLVNGVKQQVRSGIQYPGLGAPSGLGVLSYIAHGGGSKYLPPLDLTYSFLMTQEDIQLNAAPSVITINQTAATISIVDEISINNGAAAIDTNKGTSFEKSFARAQYGITIVLTPTVHEPDLDAPIEQQEGLITLRTNITFDTPHGGIDDRPLVNRRHIENEVRVSDGQTVILGGLRKKDSQDSEDKIPFLGEIPGIGKLFGSTKLVDHSTEMFFFITPRIVLDPKEQMRQIRIDELKKRPGDIPEFLEKLVEARKKEQNRFFQQSMKMIWHD